MKHPIELSYIADAVMYQTGILPQNKWQMTEDLAEKCRG